MNTIDQLPIYKLIAHREQRGIAKIVAELQWLILIIALFQLAIDGSIFTLSLSMGSVLVGFGLLISIFHYMNLFEQNFQTKIIIESWFMIAFVNWMAWHTGYTASPMLMLYYLIVVMNALTIGRLHTMMQLMLIACCYLFISAHEHSITMFTGEFALNFVSHIVPLVLVAYLTATIAEKISNSHDYLRAISDTDSLTNLHGIRTFVDLMENEIARSKRNSQNFSILRISITNSKQIAKQYNPIAEERVIRHVGSILRNHLRLCDIATRYDKSEFIVLLIEADKPGVNQVITSIQHKLEQVPAIHNGEEILIELKFGSATYPEDGLHIGQLLSAGEPAQSTIVDHKNDAKIDIKPTGTNSGAYGNT